MFHSLFSSRPSDMRSLFQILDLRRKRMVYRSEAYSIEAAIPWNLLLIAFMLNSLRRGCVLFVQRMYVRSRSGSIHSETPVKPVCPIEFCDNRDPAALPFDEAICHPSDLASLRPSVKFLKNSLRCVLSRMPLPIPRNSFESMNISLTFEKRPAFPATPPSEKEL